MTIDLTGGLEAEREFALATQPADTWDGERATGMLERSSANAEVG